MFFSKISNTLLGSGSFAKVYTIELVEDNVDDVVLKSDKTWFKFEHPNNIQKMKTIKDLCLRNQLIMKLGTITDLESNLARQNLIHPNIAQMLAQSPPTCNPSSRYILVERLDSVCSTFVSKLTGENLTKYLKDIYAGLEYLHNQYGVVFCDLSLANTGLGFDSIFKLIDFGSVKTLNKKINNPRNANRLFCSPFFHQEMIEPDQKDDLISLWYIFTRQSGHKLPWEYLQFIENTPDHQIESVIAFTKLNFFPKFTPEQKQLWPFDIAHESFYFGVKNTKTKKIV